jgi:tRNA threonylcarbamoyladenosine biosynthesis protein TsaE
MLIFSSTNESDTQRFGAALAAELPPSSVLALIGPLGAGKTRIVQALAAALGVPKDSVTSPTFVLVNEYTRGRLPLFHFDTYRLKDEDEFLALGPEEYFAAGGITAVEWADRVADFLPPERYELTLEVLDETSRRITLTGTTPAAENIVDRIAKRT